MPTIREIRESKGLSQTDLAVKSGVSIGTIGRIERQEPVQKSTVILVCQALNISPDNVEGVNIVNRVASRNA